MFLALTLGDQCHRSCSYCYADLRGRGTMSLETARKSIALALGQDPGDLQLGFFGGEPLLHFRLIRKVVEHAYAACESKPSFVMTTSGDHVTREVARYFSGIDIDVSLSAHDEDGVVTRRAARRLLAAGVEPSVVIVATPANACVLVSRIERLLEAGLRRIAISPEFYEPWSSAERLELESAYRALAKLYVERKRGGNPFSLNQFDSRLSALRSGVPLRESQCTLGASKLTVAPDGGLFPCDRLSVDSSCASTRLGHVDDGLPLAPTGDLHGQSSVCNKPCSGCEDSLTCNCQCACVNTHLTGRADVVPEVVQWHEQFLGALVRELPVETRPKKRLRPVRQLFIRATAGALSVGALSAGCREVETQEPEVEHSPNVVCEEAGYNIVGEVDLQYMDLEDLFRKKGTARARYCLHLESDDRFNLVRAHKEAIEDYLRREVSLGCLGCLTSKEEEEALGKRLIARVATILGDRLRLKGITLTILDEEEVLDEAMGQLRFMGYVGGD